MKLLVCCMVLIASTQASSFAQVRDANAKTLRSESDIFADGSYQYSFVADNGIEAEESGVAGSVVSGSSKYIDSDGTPIELTYTADENGFHPQGAHLPVGPPIPDYILRALAYIESHPNKNDPYAYVHQPDPVYETKVYQPVVPVKSTYSTYPTYQPYTKPHVYKSGFSKPQTPTNRGHSAFNRGRF